jgi:hypothetical protein
MIAREPKVQYVVTLEGAAGADIAHAHTLRYLLKYLLRSHSLRCVDARQLDHLPTQREAAEAALSTGGAE